jgi:hypothetical protein
VIKINWRLVFGFVLASLVLLSTSSPAHAQLSGAIFTTLPDGSAVNFNIYPSKDTVYLDGGPPPGAPQGAAGLPDGTYVFQVTDPPGKTLLSTDPGKCRQFKVANGIITGVVAAGGCEHMTHASVDPGAVTVQLIPFLYTPNNGGEYKAWATPVQNYLDGCSALGVSNGLDVVNCGSQPGDYHGFIPSHSKTDNFKVENNTGNREIDTYFVNSAGQNLPFICEIWIDTLGVSNTVCATSPQESAKVEDVETGVHQLAISNQTGCTVGGITVFTAQDKPQYFFGPQTIDVIVPPSFKTGTIAVYVNCL